MSGTHVWSVYGTEAERGGRRFKSSASPRTMEVTQRTMNIHLMQRMFTIAAAIKGKEKTGTHQGVY